MINTLAKGKKTGRVQCRQIEWSSGQRVGEKTMRRQWVTPILDKNSSSRNASCGGRCWNEKSEWVPETWPQTMSHSCSLNDRYSPLKGVTRDRSSSSCRETSLRRRRHKSQLAGAWQLVSQNSEKFVVSLLVCCYFLFSLLFSPKHERKNNNKVTKQFVRNAKIKFRKTFWRVIRRRDKSDF